MMMSFLRGGAGPGIGDGDILLAGGSAADDAAAVQAAEQRLAGASAGGD